MTDAYLRDALAALGDRRRMLIAALCLHRDDNVKAGDHAMAKVWNALACGLADQLDHERATLRAMEADLSPSRPLTTEELAGIRFDDEPQEPPC